MAALILAWPAAGQCVALERIWPTTLRQSVDVYVCEASFQSAIPELSSDPTRLRHAVTAAVDVWNTEAASDLRLVYRPGLPPGDGCEAWDWPEPGELVVRAEDELPQGFGFGTRAVANYRCTGFVSCNPPTVVNMERVRIRFFGANNDIPPSDYVWTFDHRDITADTSNNTRDFHTMVVHELGHAVGFPDCCGCSAPETVMNGCFTQTNQAPAVPWPSDVADLTDASNMLAYNRVTDRDIEHRRSTNGGVSWQAESFSPARQTNHRVAVTASMGSDYLVAYTETAATRRVRTFRTNGVSSPHSETTLGNQAALSGPAAAWGEIAGSGVYLVAYTELDDDRQIRYHASQTATTWPIDLLVDYRDTSGTPQPYSSKWEPALAFDAWSERFVLGFTAWDTGGAWDERGAVHVCTMGDPFGSAVWENCVNAGVFSHATPAMACSGGFECLIRRTDHTGAGAYALNSSRFFVSGGQYYPWTPVYQDAHASRLSPGMAHADGHYVSMWRTSDTWFLAQSARMATWSIPTWIDPAYAAAWLHSSPSVAWNDVYDEFSAWYITE